MGTILVVSHGQDTHAQYLLNRAREVGLDAVLWDVSLYPRNGQLTSVVNDEGEEFRLHLEGKVYRADDLAGVWWRRPNGAKSSEKKPLVWGSMFVLRVISWFGLLWILFPMRTGFHYLKTLGLHAENLFN